MVTTFQSSTKDDLCDWLDSVGSIDGVRAIDRLPQRPQAAQSRPSYRRQLPPGQNVASMPEQQIISLIRDGGVLRWRAGLVSTMGGARRGAGRASLPAGEVVKQYAFERLDTSQVYSALIALDRKLTPNAAYSGATGSGLRRLKGGVLVPFSNRAEIEGKRILLIVHGTFSNSEAIVTDGLGKTPEGRAWLASVEHDYDYVLTYDHPTLSVSPALNAFDLAGLLRPSPASMDVVCHSRGGLVARWFCEAFCDPAVSRRVVFVGSPLAGTSLAAAPRLRSTFDMLTNVADALRLAGYVAAANPLLLGVTGLLRVVGSVTGIMARPPILDAAIALIPGLDSQSRTGNNQELLRLRTNTGSADFTSGSIRYFAVRANFEPRDIGWNFLRLFSKPLQRAGDWGADIVFEDQNDLVVDSASMSEVADKRFVRVAHDFGTTDRVHHTNYFLQPETVTALRDSLS